MYMYRYIAVDWCFGWFGTIMLMQLICTPNVTGIIDVSWYVIACCIEKSATTTNTLVLGPYVTHIKMTKQSNYRKWESFR